MKRIRDILVELKKLPVGLREEIILRAFAEQVKENASILWRLSEILDRMEEKERHLSLLVNRIEVLGWETAIRNEMERKQRNRKCTQPTFKKHSKRSS